MCAATATPYPRTTPSPVGIPVGCGKRRSAWVWKDCSVAVYTGQKWKTRSCVCLKTKIPKTWSEAKKHYHSVRRCPDSLDRKPGRESPPLFISQVFFYSKLSVLLGKWYRSWFDAHEVTSQAWVIALHNQWGPLGLLVSLTLRMSVLSNPVLSKHRWQPGKQSDWLKIP